MHPDIVSNANMFYGSDLLLAVEPYPYGDHRFENPSLLCSDDGLGWRTPEGLINPIVDAPLHPSAWNSDGDLVITPDRRLALYYRLNSGQGETTLLRTTTADGHRWSAPCPLFSVKVSGRFASPALVEVGDVLCMYYVDTVAESVGRAYSTDGVTWTDDRLLFGFNGAWHVDALCAGGWHYLLLNDGRSLFLLRTADHRRWFILSSDGWRTYMDGAAPQPPDRSGFVPLLAPSPLSWDDALIYRSTFLIEHDFIRLWYGARSTANRWQVGYTHGTLGS